MVMLFIRYVVAGRLGILIPQLIPVESLFQKLKLDIHSTYLKFLRALFTPKND